MKNTSRPSWTLYDATYVLVAVPVLVVAAMMITGAVSWRGETESAKHAWEAVISEIGGGDTLGLATWYDEHKSKAPTLEFKRVVEASDAILAQLDACSSDIDRAVQANVMPSNRSLAIATVIGDLTEEAKPVLRLLASIAESEANVWNPVFLEEKADFQLPNVLKSRSLIRLLKIEFMDAYHKGDNDRAIDALSLLDRFYGPNFRPLCASDEMLRRDAASVMRKLVFLSLLHDVWTEADLDRIQKLVSREPDWQQRWQDIVRGEMLLDPPWQDEEVYGYRLLSTLDPKSRLAPSEQHERAKHHAVIAATDNVATPNHFRRMLGIQNIGNDERGWARDRWIQFPQMNTHWHYYQINKSYAETARDFADETIEQRLVKCAVAVKQFASRHDRLPDSLEEIASAGLLPEGIRFQDKPLIHYETGGDGAAATLQSNISLSTVESTKQRPAFWNGTVITK